MKHIHLFGICSLIIISLIPMKSSGQKGAVNITSKNNLTKEVLLNNNVKKIFKGRNVIALVEDEINTNIDKLTLYDLNSNVLWTKKFPFISGVSASSNNQRIVVSYDYSLSDKTKNACYDTNGNLLWEKWVTDPGITVSSDGKYGITSRISGEEGKGKFQIFDMNSGNEINIPEIGRYESFHARFLDSNRVVILTQSSRRGSNKINEKPLDNNTSVSPRAKKGRSNYKRRPPLIYLPMEFRIFNLSNRLFEIEKELRSEEGNPYWIHREVTKPLSISSDENSIFISVYKNAEWDNSQVYPPVLISVNTSGEINWENPNFKGIRRIEKIDDNLIFVTAVRKVFYLVDDNNGNQLWNFSYNVAGSQIPLNLVKKDDFLLIQTQDASSLGIAAFWKVDILSGKIISDLPAINDQILLNDNDNTAVILNKKELKLKFFK